MHTVRSQPPRENRPVSAYAPARSAQKGHEKRENSRVLLFETSGPKSIGCSGNRPRKSTCPKLRVSSFSLSDGFPPVGPDLREHTPYRLHPHTRSKTLCSTQYGVRRRPPYSLLLAGRMPPRVDLLRTFYLVLTADRRLESNSIKHAPASGFLGLVATALLISSSRVSLSRGILRL